VRWLVGGSADLAPSTRTLLKIPGAGDQGELVGRPQLPLRHPRARDGRDPERLSLSKLRRSARRSDLQ
jgi:hypothetical protein